MKIVALSDTHERHRQIQIPDGDILIFAGDSTMTGDMAAWHGFIQWLNQHPHEHKIVIGGNHDCHLTDHRRQDAVEKMENLVDGGIYLEDDYTVIDGTVIYGSPWTPAFQHWCFQKETDELPRVWEQVPAKTDILITHGPAHGTGDYLNGHGHIGDKALADELDRINPGLHLYGHVHEQTGKQDSGSYNVTVLDGDYNIKQDTAHTITYNPR